MDAIIFDIIVLGAGHAGVEATWVAAQMGKRVALITLPGVPVAAMPCNPSVGGVGKGQVVREIDALGGLMGRLADMAGIQYRTLNESKGHAVRSTRVQVDKQIYSEHARKILSSHVHITLIEDQIYKIAHENLFLLNGNEGNYCGQKLIVTGGTFFDGLLHTGNSTTAGGMIDCCPSCGIKELFSGIEVEFLRFKTGTPARLFKSSIDFSQLQEQPSQEDTPSFHWAYDPAIRLLPQISCYLTSTNARTLEIIRKSKERSPLFNGQIRGVGPRYCPSIEDKAFRYPDKDLHHVFLEPEGIDATTFYPSGVSTSLPVDVQQEFLNSIAGLESVQVSRYGYAVEYDAIDPSQLNEALEFKKIEGLYFAGQVNGSSGYEEAAAQGLIAGINAALSFDGEMLLLNRRDSYIGVLISDLVSSRRDEPYRLFTARAENRLFIREDNVFNRMYSYWNKFGKDLALNNFYQHFFYEYQILEELTRRIVFRPNPESQKYFVEMGYGVLDSALALSELLKRSALNPVKVLHNECCRLGALFSARVIESCAVSKKYEGYINRAELENERMGRVASKKICWEQLCQSDNISFECRQRIKKYRPQTFLQLQNIEGIRPATLAYVAGNLV